MCLDCLIFGRPRGAVGMRNRQCLLEDCIPTALTVLHVALTVLYVALTVLYVP